MTKKSLIVLLILLVLTLMVNGAPLDGREDESGTIKSPKSIYSQNVQYLKATDTTNTTVMSVKSGESQTERALDPQSYPRCGVPGAIGVSNKFVLSPGNAKWSKKQLTYRISKYHSRGTMTNYQVNRVIQQAFQMWSDVTDLTFRVAHPRVDFRPDIDIRFEMFNHGSRDGDVPFDGAGGVLAHAFYPSSGRVHFDDSETWTLNEGIQLLQVAAHEFGHTLGLDHSEKWEAVMTPVFRNRPGFRLHEDDIRGVQTLYGPNTFGRAPKTHPSNTLCQDTSFNTIFTDLQEVTYVIKGSKYFVLGGDGFPRELSSKWSRLPSRIDAAFSHRELDRTYFFSGDLFWRYNGITLDRGYPMLISQRFPGIPSNLNAAFVWPSNNLIYFMKENEFWRFDYSTSPAVPPGYPRVTVAWWGVYDAPVAAFTMRGQTYFAWNRGYVRINENGKVDSSSYKKIGNLFGCTDTRPGYFPSRRQSNFWNTRSGLEIDKTDSEVVSDPGYVPVEEDASEEVDVDDDEDVNVDDEVDVNEEANDDEEADDVEGVDVDEEADGDEEVDADHEEVVVEGRFFIPKEINSSKTVDKPDGNDKPLEGVILVVNNTKGVDASEEAELSRLFVPQKAGKSDEASELVTSTTVTPGGY